MKDISYQRSLQSPKENMQYFNTMHFLHFTVEGLFCLLGSGYPIRIHRPN